MISKKSVQCVIDFHKKRMNDDIESVKKSYDNGDYNMIRYYNGRIDSVKAVIEDLEEVVND